MPIHPIRRLFAVAVSLAALGLSGCGLINKQSDDGTMHRSSGVRYSSLTCSAPPFPHDRSITVTLADMGMTSMMPGTAPLGSHMMLRVSSEPVAAGTIRLVASNMGWRTHELVILPLPAGGVAGQRVPGPDGKIDETGSLGEASNSCAGNSGQGIKAGSVGWTSVTLPAGRYELVCNLRNHYANGMHQELAVR